MFSYKLSLPHCEADRADFNILNSKMSETMCGATVFTSHSSEPESMHRDFKFLVLPAKSCYCSLIFTDQLLKV